MAEVCMENYHESFREIARPGDIVVSGFNFGCGSSREQAPRRSWLRIFHSSLQEASEISPDRATFSTPFDLLHGPLGNVNTLSSQLLIMEHGDKLSSFEFIPIPPFMDRSMRCVHHSNSRLLGSSWYA
ncbi:hypothetical protein F4677DRAFT_59664 [Hypoxylon crocopeplum]|nr:hypothetical protein F4677DRAFT_59664 [Hypoxylon crocopeplum]